MPEAVVIDSMGSGRPGSRGVDGVETSRADNKRLLHRPMFVTPAGENSVRLSQASLISCSMDMVIRSLGECDKS